MWLERPEVSKEMAVTAMELLGASFANDNDNYDIGKIYFYKMLRSFNKLINILQILLL